MSPQPSEPWERRPGESAPAYAALQTYLHQGNARSVSKVAQELTKSRSLIARWSSSHDWPERAAAWDRHIAGAYAAELIEAQRTLAHRHLAVAQTALEKVTAAVAAVDPSRLSVPDVAKLWDLAVRTERDAVDVPTRVEVTGPDGAPLLQVSDLADEDRHARMVALYRELASRLGDTDDTDERTTA